MKLYPWLHQHFNQLMLGYKTGKCHHALLICSSLGMGSEILIYFIIRFIMCQYPSYEEYKYCNRCYGCKLINSGNHPDYIEVKINNDLNKFNIDLLYEIKYRIYSKSTFDGNKVVWFNHDVEYFTETAINILLKILENPPKQTWFFLSCFEPKLIVSTLRSRCCLYRINIPEESYSINWLKKKLISLKKEILITALRLSKGVPISALFLLESNKWLKREQLYKLLEKVFTDGSWLSLLTMLDNDNVLDYLYWIISLLLDILKVKLGCNVNTLINVDKKSTINSIKNNFSKEFIYNALLKMFKCYKQIFSTKSINRELILIKYLLNIKCYSQK